MGIRPTIGPTAEEILTMETNKQMRLLTICFTQSDPCLSLTNINCNDLNSKHGIAVTFVM